MMASKIKYGLVVVIDFPFPVGIAATNRILSYLKSIVSAGIRCLVLISRPTESDARIMNTHTSGTIEGIDYKFLSYSTVFPFGKSKMRKAFVYIYGLLLLILELKASSPKSVITYSGDYYLRELILSLSKLYKFDLFIEETEYPKVLKREVSPQQKKKYLRQYCLAHGMIVMTQELFRYYKSLGVKDIFLLPMTVDHSRFNQKSIHKKGDSDYLIYIGGDGGLKRDGVLDIVRVFHLSKVYLNGVKLFIGGEFETSALLFRQITEYIDENSLTDYILFLGAQHPSNVPDLLMGSKGIIMLPQSDFPSGGFPTKLGEFLASGRPVICTAVSEIPLYLNGTNSYLVKPGDFDAAAGAIVDIISNPEKASQIGLCGRELVFKEFNPGVFAEELIDFLHLDQNQD